MFSSQKSLPGGHAPLSARPPGGAIEPGRLLGQVWDSQWGLGFPTLPSQVPLGRTSHRHVLMPLRHLEKDKEKQGTASQHQHHPRHSICCCTFFKETVLICSSDTLQWVPVATVGWTRPGVRGNAGGGGVPGFHSFLTFQAV